ncbi:YbhB/YbcL family Raf kinase inhibitor-like protein [Dyella subtropica]|uniref:YbhB/YbcL family Raf kinase inhibitor-like protein n=1 Tax=Dyella subtropica TaxID=2992127 RepID=UPI002258FA9A|nr:YbhB/YbcL family Raf kinase inhibitor-like protein [Dyella subtropica]
MLKITATTLLFAATTATHAGNFSIHVDATDARGMIAARHTYNGFGCTGQNIAPAIQWQNVPANAKSLALTVYDPDAPGSGWWHWVAIDLPVTSIGLPQGGALPLGAHALRNDFGDVGWGGPCPPAGDPPHHYVFTVYALDVPSLGLPVDASAAKASAMFRQHSVGKAETTLRFGR